MANHYHKRQVNSAPVICVELDKTGWLATFFNVAPMPDGIAIPLPLTNDATLAGVKEDLAARFPGAEIVKTTRTIPTFGASGWIY